MGGGGRIALVRVVHCALVLPVLFKKTKNKTKTRISPCVSCSPVQKHVQVRVFFLQASLETCVSNS